jgi:hypothetical protein
MSPPTMCITCDDSGYLNISPVVYCDCGAGIFYEERDELNEQIKNGDLDIGLDEYINDYDSDVYYEEYMSIGLNKSNPEDNMIMFYELPFAEIELRYVMI